MFGSQSQSRKHRLSGYRHRRPGKHGLIIFLLLMSAVLLLFYMRSTSSSPYHNMEYRKVMEQNRWDFHESQIRAAQKKTPEVKPVDNTVNKAFQVIDNSDSDFAIFENKNDDDEHKDVFNDIGATDAKTEGTNVDEDSKESTYKFRFSSTGPLAETVKDDVNASRAQIFNSSRKLTKPHSALNAKLENVSAVLNVTKMKQLLPTVQKLLNTSDEIRQKAVSTVINASNPLLNKMQNSTAIEISLNKSKLVDAYDNAKQNLKDLANLSADHVTSMLNESKLNISISGHAQKLQEISVNKSLQELTEKINNLTKNFKVDSANALKVAKNLTEEVKYQSKNKTAEVLERLNTDAIRIKADILALQRNNASMAQVDKMKSFLADIDKIGQNVNSVLNMKEFKEMQQVEH